MFILRWHGKLSHESIRTMSVEEMQAEVHRVFARLKEEADAQKKAAQKSSRKIPTRR